MELDKYHSKILDLLADMEIHFNELKRKTGFPAKTLSKKLGYLRVEGLVEVSEGLKGGMKIYRITKNGFRELTKSRSFAYVRREIESLIVSPPRKEGEICLVTVPLPPNIRKMFFLYTPGEELHKESLELFKVKDLGNGAMAEESIKKKLTDLRNLLDNVFRVFIFSSVREKDSFSCFSASAKDRLFILIALSDEVRKAAETLVINGIFNTWNDAIKYLFLSDPLKKINEMVRK